MEGVTNCALNIELYEQIFDEGPRQFLNQLLEAMQEAGEELEHIEEQGDERTRELVNRALKGRALTPEEEINLKVMQDTEEAREEVISSEKQQNQLQVFASILLGLLILFITYSFMQQQ